MGLTFLPNQVVVIPGLAQVAEINWKTLTPTDITSTGITTVDGIDIDVQAISATTTIRIDSAGLYLVGGTGSTTLHVDLATVTGAEDLSTKKAWGFSLETNDNGSQWGCWMGDDEPNRFGVIRNTGSTLQTQREIASAVAFSQVNSTENTRRVWAAISLGQAIQSRYSFSTQTVSPDPILVDTASDSAAAGGTGWTPITGPGGIIRYFWTGATSRNTRHGRQGLWAA